MFIFYASYFTHASDPLLYFSVPLQADFYGMHNSGLNYPLHSVGSMTWRSENEERKGLAYPNPDFLCVSSVSVADWQPMLDSSSFN